MTDRLQEIFNKQRELHNKFISIENDNGVGLNAICGNNPFEDPIHLDDPKFQFVARGYAWRIIEEIAEALDAEGQNHELEEWADVLHFLVELSIIFNISSDQLLNISDRTRNLSGFDSLYHCFEIANLYSTFHEAISQFVMMLGMTMETLKNKPWKQSRIKTDGELLFTLFKSAFICYFSILITKGIASDQIYNAYFSKAKGNEQRIKGGV